jgi:hypothetical protein
LKIWLQKYAVRLRWDLKKNSDKIKNDYGQESEDKVTLENMSGNKKVNTK